MDITQLLAFSVKNKASDLHLSAGLPPLLKERLKSPHQIIFLITQLRYLPPCVSVNQINKMSPDCALY